MSLHFLLVTAQCFLHHILTIVKSNYCALFWSYFHTGVNNLLLFSLLPALFFIFLLCFTAFVQAFPHIFISLASDSCLLRSELFIGLKREKITRFSLLFFFLKLLPLSLFNLLLQRRINNIFLFVEQVLFSLGCLFKGVFNLADYIECLFFLNQSIQISEFLFNDSLNYDVILKHFFRGEVLVLVSSDNIHPLAIVQIDEVV